MVNVLFISRFTNWKRVECSMSVTVSPLKLSFLLIKVVKKCLSYNYPTLLGIPVAAGTGAFIEWGLHAYILHTWCTFLGKN